MCWWFCLCTWIPAQDSDATQPELAEGMAAPVEPPAADAPDVVDESTEIPIPTAMEMEEVLEELLVEPDPRDPSVTPARPGQKVDVMVTVPLEDEDWLCPNMFRFNNVHCLSKCCILSLRNLLRHLPRRPRWSSPRRRRVYCQHCWKLSRSMCLGCTSFLKVCFSVCKQCIFFPWGCRLVSKLCRASFLIRPLGHHLEVAVHRQSLDLMHLAFFFGVFFCHQRLSI